MRNGKTRESELLSSLASEALTAQELADELGMTNPNVHQILHQAKKEGLVKPHKLTVYQLTDFGERYEKWLRDQPTG